jgi:hypothetical protein
MHAQAHHPNDVFPCACCQTPGSLDLCENNLGTGGAAALAATLGKLKSLRSLDLSNNDLGGPTGAAAQLLAATLGELKELSGNPGGTIEVGGAALCWWAAASSRSSSRSSSRHLRTWSSRCLRR